MRIRRLGWAGLEIEAGGAPGTDAPGNDARAVAVIDLLEDLGASTKLLGEPRTELPPATAGAASLALMTHLHHDHADVPAVARALAPDGVVLRPAPMDGPPLERGGTMDAERALEKHGLRTQVVAPWETVTVGPFTVTALPAVDGFGDAQVSWVLEADGTRILHAGDTLMHGWWWRAVMRTGPIDVAFLPVNGAVVSLPHRQPASRLPVDMGPREAVEAARALQARLAVPMHYGTIHNPPVYTELDGAADTFVALAEEHGVPARIVEPGELVPLPEPAAVKEGAAVA